MSFNLFIKFLGEGFHCSQCGRMRVTTKYQLRDGDLILATFRLCDECQDKGYEVKFTPKDVVGERALIQAHERRDRLLRKRRVRLSRKLEAGVAQDIGGRTMPGSGNTKHAKADIRKMDQWRLEHKFTDSVAHYRLMVEDLAAVVNHANMFGEWPGLIINFRKLKRAFMVIPYELFLWVKDILDADPALNKGPKDRAKAPVPEDQSLGSDRLPAGGHEPARGGEARHPDVDAEHPGQGKTHGRLPRLVGGKLVR